MNYPDFIELPFIRETNPPKGFDNCDQYPESLPRYFIEHYTKEKDKIFDPFMGFGTTARVAEEMERIPYGIEADGARHALAAAALEHWQNILHADSADMLQYPWPKMDFCVTSPPYMRTYEQWNPLYGGHPGYKGYDAYLQRLGYIFGQVKQRMKKKALIVVQADNLQKPRKSYTPLVRDFSTVISEHFKPEAEVIVRWTNPQDDYSHTHCLVFKNA